MCPKPRVVINFRVSNESSWFNFTGKKKKKTHKIIRKGPEISSFFFFFNKSALLVQFNLIYLHYCELTIYFK